MELRFGIERRLASRASAGREQSLTVVNYIFAIDTRWLKGAETSGADCFVNSAGG